jgi:hypothetical protein
MLTRWAAFAPGTRMPDSVDELEFSQRAALQTADADLFALLANQAPAELELAAMNGSLATAAPTQQELQDAAKAAQIQQILDTTNGNPWGQPGYYEGDTFVPPLPANLTQAFTLESLDPQLAARLKAEATPAPAPTPEQQRDAALFSAYAYS